MSSLWRYCVGKILEEDGITTIREEDLNNRDSQHESGETNRNVNIAAILAVVVFLSLVLLLLHGKKSDSTQPPAIQTTGPSVTETVPDAPEKKANNPTDGLEGETQETVEETHEETEVEAQGIPLTRCSEIRDSENRDKENTKDIDFGHWTDTYGNVHKYSIKFWVSAKSNLVNTEYVEYELGKQYSRLVLKVVAEENSADGARTKIKIYGDRNFINGSYEGGTFLEESTWIYNDTQEIQIEVDISGIDRLYIECSTDAKVHCYCIVDASVYQ